MIVKKDKTQYMTGMVSEEWAIDNGFYVIDDKTVCDKIIFSFPDFEFVFDESGNVIDVTTNKTPEPTEEERISELETQNQLLTDCILEMSEIIYGGDSE